MIGMTVGDERARLRLRRIDPRIGGPDIDAFGKRLDPGTEARHDGYMVERPPAAKRIIERRAAFTFRNEPETI